MQTRRVALLFTLLLCSLPVWANDNSAPAKALIAFSSERELAEYLARLPRRPQITTATAGALD
jgi:hypothetical protein